MEATLIGVLASEPPSGGGVRPPLDALRDAGAQDVHEQRRHHYEARAAVYEVRARGRRNVTATEKTKMLVLLGAAASLLKDAPVSEPSWQRTAEDFLNEYEKFRDA